MALFSNQALWVTLPAFPVPLCSPTARPGAAADKPAAARSHYGRPATCGWLAILFLVFSGSSSAQLSFDGMEHLFTEPKSYTALFTPHPPEIDGHLQDSVWAKAPWSDLFTDIEGDRKPAPAFATRVKMLWNDSSLFIAATLEEPHVWAFLQQRDAVVYYDNDFEVFIDPDNDTHQYYEIEVNARNTVFDLFMVRPYRNGSAALIGFDLAGFRSAVRVQGTLNRPADRDTGWTVEMKIPFRSILPGNQWRPPAEGALWRINFSRVQWDTEVSAGTYVKKKDGAGKLLPEHNWVWSPQGVINMHYPERWGYLKFTRHPSGSGSFTLPYAEKRRHLLWLLYYRQKSFWAKEGRYAATLQALGAAGEGTTVEGKQNSIRMEATSRQFIIYSTDNESTITINQDGLVQPFKK